MKCGSPDRLIRGVFKIIPNTTGRTYRYAIRISRQSILPPFTPPVRLTITDHLVIDRVDQIDECAEVLAGLACHEL